MFSSMNLFKILEEKIEENIRVKTLSIAIFFILKTKLEKCIGNGLTNRPCLH